MTNSRLGEAPAATTTLSSTYHSSGQSQVAQRDLERIDEEQFPGEFAADALLHRREVRRAVEAEEPLCALCLSSLQSELGITNCKICSKEFPDQCYYCMDCDLKVCASCFLITDADTFDRNEKTHVDGETKCLGLLDTALLLAACNGSEEVVRFLIKDGVNNIDVCNRDGETPLLLALANGHKELVLLLVEEGADVFAGVADVVADESDQTVLHMAARMGLESLALMLVAKGSRINAMDETDQTPLHVAARMGQTDLAQVLVEKGANIDATDDIFQTPLHEAAQRGQERLALMLVEKGASVNAADEIGLTPLHMAARLGQTGLALGLVEKGANIDATDDIFQTPLHEAAEMGQERVVQMLVEKGASINATDVFGRTPFDLAAQIKNATAGVFLLHAAMCLK